MLYIFTRIKKERHSFVSEKKIVWTLESVSSFPMFFSISFLRYGKNCFGLEFFFIAFCEAQSLRSFKTLRFASKNAEGKNADVRLFFVQHTSARRRNDEKQNVKFFNVHLQSIFLLSKIELKNIGEIRSVQNFKDRGGSNKR